MLKAAKKENSSPLHDRARTRDAHPWNRAEKSRCDSEKPRRGFFSGSPKSRRARRFNSWNCIELLRRADQNRVRVHPSHKVNTVDTNNVVHDVKGNVTSKPSSRQTSDVSQLHWDFDNRLTSVDTDNDGTLDAQYTYDATGRRVTKNNTVFVCNGQQVMAEYTLGTAATSPTEQYVYGTYIDEPVLKERTGSLTYYHRNQQYSVVGLTDAAGNVIEHYAYDAYGDVDILDTSLSLLAAGVAGNAYTYTGRRYESETGDYFFRARYYDAELGRFLGRDPLEYADGMSLYRSYFACSLMDPFGEQTANGMVDGFAQCQKMFPTDAISQNICKRFVIAKGGPLKLNRPGKFDFRGAINAAIGSTYRCGSLTASVAGPKVITPWGDIETALELTAEVSECGSGSSGTGYVVSWKATAKSEFCIGPSVKLPVSEFAKKFDPKACKKCTNPSPCVSKLIQGSAKLDFTGKAGVVFTGSVQTSTSLVPFDPSGTEISLEVNTSKYAGAQLCATLNANLTGQDVISFRPPRS